MTAGSQGASDFRTPRTFAFSPVSCHLNVPCLLPLLAAGLGSNPSSATRRLWPWAAAYAL